MKKNDEAKPCWMTRICLSLLLVLCLGLAGQLHAQGGPPPPPGGGGGGSSGGSGGGGGGGGGCLIHLLK